MNRSNHFFFSSSHSSTYKLRQTSKKDYKWIKEGKRQILLFFCKALAIFFKTAKLLPLPTPTPLFLSSPYFPLSFFSFSPLVFWFIYCLLATQPNEPVKTCLSLLAENSSMVPYLIQSNSQTPNNRHCLYMIWLLVMSWCLLLFLPSTPVHSASATQDSCCSWHIHTQGPHIDPPLYLQCFSPDIYGPCLSSF